MLKYQQNIETHHMVDDDMPLMLAFESFRKDFGYTAVMVYKEDMVYRIRHRLLADMILKEAQKVITTKNLPLQAFINKTAIEATLIIKAKDDHD